jgi:hypothetical protein
LECITQPGERMRLTRAPDWDGSLAKALGRMGLMTQSKSVTKWDSPPFGTTERVSPQLASLSGEANRGAMPRSGYVQAFWFVPAEVSSLASRLWDLL